MYPNKYTPKKSICDPRKRVIFRIESIAANADRFYAILSVHNYAQKSAYIEGKRLLCAFYAE